MILFEGGFIKKSGSSYVYHYNKTDHLGNVRAVLQATGTNSLTRVQRTDYYPFGLAHEYQNTNLNRYLYNGKELQTQTMASSMWGGPGSGTFNVYDFGSRFYNPVLGRWSNIDPRLQFANPYLYAANNPAMFVDPDGEFAWLLGAAIGGIVNAIVATFNGGDTGKAFFTGALSGAIGAGAGSYVGSLTGTVGAAGGALSGAAGGFAGGFTAGAGNSWLNGGSFGQGWIAGLKSGGIGAAGGALMGGINGGIRAIEAGGNFWTGKGATYDFAVDGFDDSPITMGKRNGKTMVHSNRYARNFYNEEFHEVKGLEEIIADGRVPDNSRYSSTRTGHVYKKQEGGSWGKVLGSTVKNRTLQGYDIYLYRGAFTSKEMLYTVMGHELIHVNMFTAGIVSEDQEATAAQWSNTQAKLLGVNLRSELPSGEIMRQYYVPYKTIIK